jgi:hypothetical protein
MAESFRKWVRGLTGPPGVEQRPLVDVPTLALTEASLGEEPTRWGIAAAIDSADYIVERLPEFGEDPAAELLLRRAVESTTLATLRALVANDPDALWPSSEAGDATASYVRRDISLEAVVRGIHLCQERLTSLLSGEIARLCDTASSLEETSTTTGFLFSCFDRFVAQVSAYYALERTRWLDSSGAVRRDLVETILAGGSPDPKTTALALGHDLEAPQCALVLWVVDPVAFAGSPEDLERLVDRLAFESEARTCLRLWAGPATLHVWLAGCAVPGLRTRLSAQTPPAYVNIAVGDVGLGLAGFRSSHRQAQAAERVARLQGQGADPVTFYAAIELVGLLSEDIESARAFVARVLGPIADGSPEMAELRATLAVYLAAEHRVATSARLLHAHRNTVNYRIKKAEGLLGATVRDDSLELRCALLLIDVLGRAVLPGTAER